MYPTKKIENVNWVNGKAPHSFRYLHAMVAAAFYANRADQQNLALQWLEKYECENRIACEEYDLFLDGAIKSSGLTFNRKKLSRFQLLRKKVAAAVKTMALKQSEGTGLCAKDSPRKNLVQAAYQIYCPAFRTLSEQTKCAGFSETAESCTTTEALVASLNHGSRQLILSSSRILAYRHLGFKDCEKPWKVEIECEIADSKPIYKLNCQKIGNTFPITIDCT